MNEIVALIAPPQPSQVKLTLWPGLNRPSAVSGLDYAQAGTINTGKRPDELRPGGTALQANGALSQSNAVLLDGIDNTEMISQTFIVRPAVEGIQEFKVLTNNPGAEYSRSVGAVAAFGVVA